MGGLPVRVFAHAYAAEVAGVVLIESMNPREAASPPATTAPPAGRRAHQQVSSILTLPARVGLVRLFDRVARGQGCPQTMQTPIRRFSVTAALLQAAVDEGQGYAGKVSRRRGAVTTFGDMPLIVLSRGLPEDREQKWQREQTELLQLSSIASRCSPTRAATTSNLTSQRPRSGRSCRWSRSFATRKVSERADRTRSAREIRSAD